MKLLLFDAANTLIYKPSLWTKIHDVLQYHGFSVEDEVLKERHKLLSEVIDFPDRTSKEFYHKFNSELLLSLGIIPNYKILNDLFDKCTYQPWAKFEDCSYLYDISLPKAIISNFNSSLETIISELFSQSLFDKIIISENEKIRKPSVEFYQIAIDKMNVNPEDVLYIGDSLKLDIIPANELGIKTLLIDRNNIYKGYANRISDFHELKKYL